MTDTWDGRPPDAAAERDGWHWLAQGKQPVLMWWNAEYQVWPSVRRDITPPLAAHYYSYVAPVLTPAEVAAREAAAAEAMRERAAVAAYSMPSYASFGPDGIAMAPDGLPEPGSPYDRGAYDARRRIAALPLPDAGAALSAAERRGWNACAAVARRQGVAIEDRGEPT